MVMLLMMKVCICCQESCLDIRACVFRPTTPAKPQALQSSVPCCIVLAANVALYQLLLHQETPVWRAALRAMHAAQYNGEYT